MFPSYFDYIFVQVQLRQKLRLRPEVSPKFLPTSGPNPNRKARPDLQLWLVASEWSDTEAGREVLAAWDCILE